MDENDDALYEQFVEESMARSIREQAHETQQTEEELQRELQLTLNDIMQEIEQEVQNNNNSNRARVRVIHDGTPNNINARIHIDNIPERGTPFSIQRRPVLRTFLRNLLVFDYFLLLLLFPLSLYTILRSGFNVMTFSEEDFLKEIVNYFKYIRIFSDDGKSLMVYKEGKIGLLGKFHNIIVFYSSPMVKKLFQLAQKRELLLNIAIAIYKPIVKVTTITAYLTYGLGGTVYLIAAGFFFMLCLALSVMRRYKGVHQMITKSLDSVASIPGVF